MNSRTMGNSEPKNLTLLMNLGPSKQCYTT